MGNKLLLIDWTFSEAYVNDLRKVNSMKSRMEFEPLVEVIENKVLTSGVKKPININEHVFGSLTTSMVDDVDLQSFSVRVILNSKSKFVAAVLIGDANVLKNEYLEALKQKMREPNLGAKLLLGGNGVHYWKLLLGGNGVHYWNRHCYSF